MPLRSAPNLRRAASRIDRNTPSAVHGDGSPPGAALDGLQAGDVAAGLAHRLHVGDGGADVFGRHIGAVEPGDLAPEGVEQAAAVERLGAEG